MEFRSFVNGLNKSGAMQTVKNTYVGSIELRRSSRGNAARPIAKIKRNWPFVGLRPSSHRTR